MNRPCFILSTCGTSLLTNDSGGLRKTLIDNANIKRKEELSEETVNAIEAHIERRRQELLAAPLERVVSLSAELNAIGKLYGGRFDDNPRDHHALLCTDTWLGEQAARLVETWLRDKGFGVELIRHTDLQTTDLQTFQSAMSDLVQWCEEILPKWQKNGYHTVFNLTGGFKSVQGFLQALAMFYADESIYVFESGRELLRLPRLPITLTAEETVRSHLSTFRRLGAGFPIAKDDCTGIPETLLLEIDREVTLSAWGELVWNQAKKTFYGENLLEPISPLLTFSESFRRSIENLPRDRLILVNERLDQLAIYLESEGQHNPKALNFKKLQGKPTPPSTHECYAWSDRDAKRLYGHYRDTVFVIDSLGKHL